MRDGYLIFSVILPSLSLFKKIEKLICGFFQKGLFKIMILCYNILYYSERVCYELSRDLPPLTRGKS